MKTKVVDLENKAAGEITLNKDVFGLPVRADILHRVMEWQRARARAGTHKVKTVGEVSGTKKKPFKQKGTGNARQGSTRSAQMRGGATIFGPVVRDHGYSLNKKVRKLGLKTALSAKQAEGKLFILADTKLKEAKTQALAGKLEKLGFRAPLIIDGAEVNENFSKAVRNLHGADVLPQQGANVYDILRHDELVLTQAAVKDLEARLK